MKQIELVKSIHIEAEATAVYSHLADISNHPGLQPLVVETREIERTVADDGQTVIHFFSVEQFHFLGFIPYQNKIRVKMTQIPEEHLLIQAVDSFPNITLISRTTFQPDATGTAVTETIHISTPNFVAGYVQKTADAAHDVLMQNLKTRLETPQKQNP
ncbi:MAG: SRPBCC family protein [Anaerolineae bacterium]|nr:SRPBCC family protein [Anaerolineae bacterium]